ncbi:hypothetical protein LS68_006465 [Helicobacter sp. MIT 05-5293]|uniref:hypothetical protein n=1 Tax=Helicobacter sp. MIT 05-5293 TaxID=1548149 RepID=UPI0010FE2458|nr:hypothetical protein [Helicobacter sp. MIT 05-5293]TLD80399.1 hypothetical protein LS68_006465 [Helicobacter sp. MIT 05-5293]
MSFAAGYIIGAMCASDPSSCEICESCQDRFRIGVGGIYAAYQAEDDIRNYGGYLNLEYRGATPKGRFQFVIAGHAGAAKSNASSKSLTLMGRDFDKNTAMFVEARPKVGVNLLTSHRPLYLNVVYTLNNAISHYSSDNGIKTIVHQVGLELDGIVRKSSKLRIEYSLGYDYVFDGFYGIYGISSSRIRAQGGYTLRGSLGFAYDITQNVHYYMKANLKYQSLNDVANNIAYYPQSRSYTAGLELGFGF